MFNTSCQIKTKHLANKPGQTYIYIFVCMCVCVNVSVNQCPISEKIQLALGSNTILSSWSDRVIAFHKRSSQLVHQIKKIQNQRVHTELNHDINDSLGNLELKLCDRGWNKNIRLITPIHEVTMGDVETSFMCTDMRVSWSVQCMHTVLFTIEHGLDMPYLTGMCIWLTWFNKYKLLTQDRLCSSGCLPGVC